MSVLRVINRLSSSLNVGADAVVVAGGEGFQVVEPMDGDSIFRGIVADCSSVAGDIAFGDIVGRFSTNQEAVTTQNGVGSEGGSLRRVGKRSVRENVRVKKFDSAYLE